MSESFVDIHTHILPGLDDGPQDMAESLALCRALVAEGVVLAVATPHQARSSFDNSNDAIRDALVPLRDRLREQAVPLEVLPGADVRIDVDLVRRLQNDELMTLGDTGQYVLLELPHDVAFPLGDLAGELGETGVMPILSHPERNAAIVRNPECLRPWVGAGVMLQVTLDSLLGYWGAAAQRTARWILDEGLAAVLASDTHSVTERPPRHRTAWREVSTRWGVVAARRLMVDVPRRIACMSVAASRGPVRN